MFINVSKFELIYDVAIVLQCSIENDRVCYALNLEMSEQILLSLREATINAFEIYYNLISVPTIWQKLPQPLPESAPQELLSKNLQKKMIVKLSRYLSLITTGVGH